jgi:single-stranded-DNA-specific exonuclease
MIAAMTKRWVVREAAPETFIRTISDINPASAVVPQLLWNRGIRLPDEARRFFAPAYETGIHDPFLFSQMPSAVERIFGALETGESVTVFGDYDADGITGSTVLITTLCEIEKKIRSTEGSCVSSYIPHRDKEGYGLQMAAVDLLAARGTKVIITVDCGIACVREIARARELGMDVIVVDHHQFGDELPNGILIHPSIPNETYPFKSLAAVGVSWKLACGLIHEARKRGLDIMGSFEKWLLDLVSIATITDIVPLVGENRVLELFGLRVLNKTRRPGLMALIERAGLTPGAISVRDIGFAIGPRINAAGRMEHASVALELLLASTEDEATEAAARVEALNRARQEATQVMMKQAEEMLEQAAQNVRLHVLWNEAWSPALVGLVAGRIADRYGMPAVAIGKHGDHWIGSGRSFPAYDITAAVKRVGDGLLTRSGGHIQACGFALADDEHVPMFAERLRTDAETNVRSEDLGPTLDVDAVIGLDQAHWPLVESLKTFAPFGCGNPEPLFVARGVRVLSAGTVGQTGKHVRFTGRDGSGSVQKFIAFNFGSRAAEIVTDGLIDVAFHLEENEWNGRRELQCKVIDVAPAR